MSLREIFDFVVNYPIPSMWIFGGIGALILISFLIAVEPRK